MDAQEDGNNAVNLVLIRHGKPDIGVDSGFPGPHLEPTGITQAMTIAKVLNNKNIQAVYQSDYTRVLDTAKPFLEAGKPKYVESCIGLREREKRLESHESLVCRAQGWLQSQMPVMSRQNSAVFSHCGPINIILEYLDPGHDLMEYPYIDEYFCRTPMGGVWELVFDDSGFRSGHLIYDGNI